VEDQTFAIRIRPRAVHASQELDDVRDEVDVAALTVLWRADATSREAAPNAHDGILEVDVVPAEREQLALPHSRLKGDEAHRAIGLLC
jgi:hypothetical protein